MHCGGVIISEKTGVKYKCPACYAVCEYGGAVSFGGKDGKTPLCGDCGLEMEVMCSKDHRCTCNNDVHSGIRYCPLCGKAICPECGSHDVSQVSRVTGYLADVAGWNPGKLQELKDRHRIEIIDGVPT